MVHLVHNRGCSFDDASPVWGTTVFVHLASTTLACGKLDVFFSVARIVDPSMESSGIENAVLSTRSQIGFSPIRESTVFPIVLVVEGEVVCQTVTVSTGIRLS